MLAEVINLNENTVFEDITAFINLPHYSHNTKIAYEKGVRDFFRIIKGKELEFLTIGDLDIKKKDVERFRVILQEEGNSNSTINNKVAGVRKLYDELIANEYELKNDFFRAIKKLDDDTNSYDPFTVEEVLELSELAKEELHNKEIKSKFILFLMDTCIRKAASLKLKWSDFEIVNGEEVKINAIDKGNKHFRAKIHYNFYKELLELKTDSEYVFNITQSSIDTMLPRLIKKLNVSSSRNLAIHSIRKTGIEFKYNYTGDIKVAQKAANHADASLTLKTYLTGNDYGVLGAVSLQHETKDDIMDNLNVDQWNELFANLDYETKNKLKNKASELFNL